MRILTAADVFDAITSRRSYRDPIAPAAAAEFLSAQAGKLLDTRVCEALRAVVRHEESPILMESAGGSLAR